VGGLYVDTVPLEASVKILNIKPKFTQGMELQNGKYHVQVSAPGHITCHTWFEVKKSQKNYLKIELSKNVIQVSEARTRYNNASGGAYALAASAEEISKAIADAPNGSTIRIPPGTYTIPGYALYKDLTLLGSNPYSTELVLSDTMMAILSGHLDLSGLSIRYASEKGNPVCYSGEGATLSVTNCRATGGTYSGIDVNGAATVTQCEIIGNKQAGVHVYGKSKVRVIKSYVAENWSNGFAFKEGAVPDIIQCVVVGNKGSGIGVYEGGNPTVKGCDIFQNNQFGICITQQGKGVFQECTITENILSGVLIRDGSAPQVEQCTIAENKQTGIIFVEKGMGSIIGNTIYGNGYDAIDVSEGCKPTFSGNDVKGSLTGIARDKL